MAEPIAYKIMTEAEHAQMRRDGVFPGSAADIADGFIHLSTAAQLAGTLDKHFAGLSNLVICAVDLTRLGETVRWEPSRGGDLFPHIHGPLPSTAVIATTPIRRGEDGAVLIPG